MSDSSLEVAFPLRLAPASQLKEAVAAIAEANGLGVVETRTAHPDAYFAELESLAAEGNLPDVFLVSTRSLSRWATDGEVLDLDPLTLGIPARAGVRVEGRLCGLGLGLTAPTVLLDAAVLAELGLGAPDLNWTWREFEHVLSVIREHTGSHAITESLYQVLSLDTRWLSIDRGKEHSYGLHTETLLTMLNSLQGLREAEIVPAPETFLQVRFDLDENFRSGELPVTIALAHDLVGHASLLSGRELFLLPLPAWHDDLPQVHTRPTAVWCVAGASDNTEEALVLLQHLATDERAVRSLGLEAGLPPADEMRVALRSDLGALEGQVFDFLESRISQDEDAHDAEPLLFLELMEGPFAIAVYEFLAGYLTPRAACDAIQTGFDELNATLADRVKRARALRAPPLAAALLDRIIDVPLQVKTYGAT